MNGDFEAVFVDDGHPFDRLLSGDVLGRDRGLVHGYAPGHGHPAYPCFCLSLESVR